MSNRLTILHGDSVEQLRTLPAESVQLCVTSPPYDKLRTYGGHSWDFEGTARELFRVLTAGAIVCWNVGAQVVDGSESLTPFKQAIYFVEQCGFRLHDTMLYAKLNGAKPDCQRYNQCFEYVFILSKGKPTTVNLIKDKPNITRIREKHVEGYFRVRMETESLRPRMADGMAPWMDRLRCIGNGQVPAVAKLAWELLAPSTNS